MKTLGRNADNDLYLEAGGLAIVKNADAQIAIIESILQTQQGELQFDESKGIDYFGTVLQHPSYIEFWAAQVKTQISQLDFVSTIEDFTYTFDRASSSLIWSMTVVNSDNERLFLDKKRTVVDGSPGIDISWDNIYDKPVGIEESITLVQSMHEEASESRELLTSSSTFEQTKDLLNRIVFDTSDKNYIKSRTITFDFIGVPLGAVIDFSNLRIDLANTSTDGGEYYAPFSISISDGTRFLVSKTITPTRTGNKVIFEDGTQHHTIMKGGSVSISFKGDITAIWSALGDETEEDRSNEILYPIFTTAKGKAFPYLKGITIGDRVPLVRIGNGAFRGYENLSSISWEIKDETLITLGSYSFAGCTSLESLNWMPTTTSEIGEGCFSSCTNLLSLDGLKNTQITILPKSCFAHCASIKTISSLPQGITALQDKVFYGCSGLVSIDGLPNTIETIGESCFGLCSSVETILYPPMNLKSLGNTCFQDCTALTSVYLPPSVVSFGENVFDGCSSLTNIMCDALTTISVSSDTLGNASPIIYVPTDIEESYKSNSFWAQYPIYKYGVFRFELKNVPRGTQFLGREGELESDSIWTIQYGEESAVQRFSPSTFIKPSFTVQEPQESLVVTIKGFIKKITASQERYPFLEANNSNSCPYLTAVEIKDSPLEFIGDYAFAQCPNLVGIDCGLEEERPYCLGERAFWGCQSLTDTSWLKSGLGNLVKETISSYQEDEEGNISLVETEVKYPAFGEGCFYQSGITSLSYDTENVTSLSPYCFAETKITTLNGISNNSTVLEVVGEYCFAGCKNLTDISALATTGVKTLPDFCFYKCSALNSLHGIENLNSEIVDTEGAIIESMGESVFAYSGISSLSPLADSIHITALTPSMFAYTNIESLNGITDKITSLGNSCFKGCKSLTDISALLESSVTEIPAYGFAECSSLKHLIGCWNISVINEYAFYNCSSLISTTGLGETLLSIGDYAFSNCSSLKAMVLTTPYAPALIGKPFTGTNISSIPLYVREEYIPVFSSIPDWYAFREVTQRSIKIHLEDIGGESEDALNISEENALHTGVKVSYDIDSPSDKGMWFVDYGDGSPIEHFYSKGDFVQQAIPSSGHQYPIRGNYTITLYGDIIELWSTNRKDATTANDILDGTYPKKTPDLIDFKPFLSGLEVNASSISISSQYLAKIGDFTFFDYGQPVSSLLNNDIELNVSISMGIGGTIGAYAFAKKESTHGPIGNIETFNAEFVYDYAFYNAALTSSSAFSSITNRREEGQEPFGAWAFANNPYLTEVSGFSSLQIVEEGMFANCSAITSTNGMTSVSRIEADGFYGCSSLTTVRDFNSSLDYIGEGAFAGCYNITKIFMASLIPPYLAEHGFSEIVFANDKVQIFVPSGTVEAYRTSPFWYKFVGTVLSRSISFTLNVEKGTRLNAGSGIVEATGNWVLSYGEGEQSFTFSPGTTHLPAYTFKSRGTKKIEFSGAVSKIYCSESSYPLFGHGSVSGTNTLLTKVEASDEMEIVELGDNVFNGCSNLTAILNLPSVSKLGTNAFANAISLSDISGLTGVSSLGERAFSGCSSLTSLYGLSSVSTVGASAFEGCSKLQTIDGLGTGLSVIGDNAFKGCPLSEVQIFAPTPPSVSINAFGDTTPLSIPLYVRTKTLDDYKTHAMWSSLFTDIRSRYIEFTLSACPSNLQVGGDSGYVESDTFWVVDWDAYSSSSVASKKGLEPSLLPSYTFSTPGDHTIRLEGAITSIAGSISSVDINENEEPTNIEGTPFISLSQSSTGDIYEGDRHFLTQVYRSEYATLTKVGDGAFLKNTNLKNIYLSGVKEIGLAACAYDTSLKELPIIDVASFIDKYAFYGCTGITQITGLNGVPNPPNGKPWIGEYAFGGIPHIEYIQVGQENASIATITDTSFGYYDPETDKKKVFVYVPLKAVTSYMFNEQWNKFSIAAQIISFTLENVPSGTSILGVSDTNAVGVARVESESRWSVNWDDGSISTMESSQTSFPTHTYLYDPNADEFEKERWELIDGVYYRKKIEISIEGTIKSLSCQSSSNSPFLAIELGKGNPYLTQVTASDTMASLTMLGDFLFQGCSNLETVTGFTHITTIGQQAFQGCTSLDNIGDNTSGFIRCVSVGNKAFANCESLQNLASFAMLRVIGIRAFENCISLTGTTGMGSGYSLLTLEDWHNQGLVATFGAYAFEGCGFGAIDMDNYAMPPTIQNTTFPGDPSNVLVFVSPLSGVKEAYISAPVWIRYFQNIIAASDITIQIGENELGSITRDVNGNALSGPAIYGGNGRLAFADSYVLIDWGDGTTTQSMVKESDEKNGWTFPNHFYTKDVSGPVVVKIRGNITKLYTADGGDIPLTSTQLPDDSKKPFIALSSYDTIIIEDPETGTRTTTQSLSDERRYDFKIQSLSFGNGSRLTKIGTYSFASCNIGSITFGKPTEWDEEIKNDAGVVTQTIHHKGAMTIGDCAFMSCPYLSSIIGVEGSLDDIGKYAFYGCSALTNTTFLAGAKSIGVEAFKDCVSLDSITLPSTLLSVATSAFEGCYSITNGITWEQSTDSTILSNGNITIGDRAFYGCIGANNEEWQVSLPSQVHTIGAQAFYNCGMKEFTWGNVTHVSTSAIPYSFIEGYSGCFEGCSNIETVNILHSVTKIPARTFCKCPKLITVYAINGLHTIDAYAFYGCRSLSDSSFENLMSSATGELGAYAFARCFALQNVVIPSTITSLGEGCFSRSSTDFYEGNYLHDDSFVPSVPSTFYRIYEFENWMTQNYGKKRMDVWGVYDSILTASESDTVTTRLNFSWDGSLSNASIGSGCFMNCLGLNIDWVNFPSLLQIPSYCFYNCKTLFNDTNLASLPSTIISFGRFALAKTGIRGLGRKSNDTVLPLSASFAPGLFLGCSNLETFGDGEDGLKTLFSTIPSSIPDGCFYGCSNLSNINALTTQCPSITRIGKYAFANCSSLSSKGTTNITNALSNITEIDDGSFQGCTGLNKFQGIPNVTYYPFRSFYGCTSISEITQFATPAENTQVSLEGDSFGGIEGIWRICLPYPTNVVTVEVASGKNENNEVFQTADPFSGISKSQKATTFVEVPSDILESYLNDSYWSQFAVTTPMGDLIPAVQLKLKVPAGGGTVYCNGGVRIEDDTQVILDWGDGTDMYSFTQTGGDSAISLEGYYHTYSAEDFPEERTVTLSYFGKVKEIFGRGDDKSTSVVKNKTVVPAISTTLPSIVEGGVGTQAVNTWLTGVTFPGEYLQRIGDGAFGYCTNLSAVGVMPSTITSLGNCAFFGCESIENLNFLPTSLSAVGLGKFCFAYCTGLRNFSRFTECTNITDIPDGCFNSISNRTMTFETLDWLPPNVTSIGVGAFQLVYFSSFKITDTNTNYITIGNYAFRQNDALTSLQGINMNLTGTNAFRQCAHLASLEGISLASTNTTIPVSTFKDCTSLTSLSGLPLGITSIGDGAFNNTGITNLNGCPSTVTTLGNPNSQWTEDFENNMGGVFGNNSRLTSLNGMPSSVTTLGTAAFKGCSQLASLEHISSNISSLSAYCFHSTGLLDLDYIPTSITQLGEHCFEECSKMVDISGLDTLSISSLPRYCFANCSTLSSIIESGTQKGIPSTVTMIGDYCFQGCSNIETIYLRRWYAGDTREITYLGETNVFEYDLLKDTIKIYIPTGSLNKYQSDWGTESRFSKEGTFVEYSI